ncbi:hypothetical protein M878_08590 [Streptomyces roseochromogenus subsp. oscitans DS 12.976]|uniref:Uncharacterized protein n=1 Tax=Streptomyces roseochromogenus subsp. oscitans DS 12.976 TaxID=1352936 RepID=V6KRZ9_STRRC|nr:hypothetical protein M878_08590 [Streptomyces roseochromogenus subsp. oscitans DS 12.976]
MERGGQTDVDEADGELTVDLIGSDGRSEAELLSERQEFGRRVAEDDDLLDFGPGGVDGCVCAAEAGTQQTDLGRALSLLLSLVLPPLSLPPAGTVFGPCSTRAPAARAFSVGVVTPWARKHGMAQSAPPFRLLRSRSPPTGYGSPVWNGLIIPPAGSCPCGVPGQRSTVARRAGRSTRKGTNMSRITTSAAIDTRYYNSYGFAGGYLPKDRAHTRC